MFLDETAFDYFNYLERKAQKHSTQYYPLRDFLRFSLLLETLVLNNNVILPVFHEDSPYVRAISRFYNINNLIDNELICFAWSESEKLFHNTGLCNHLEKKFINIPYRSYLDDYLHEFVLDIGGYVNTLSTDPSKWFFYRTKFNNSYSVEIASDKKLYVKACNVLYEETKIMREMGRPIRLFIPPITSLILAELMSDNLDVSLADLIFKYRKRFKKFRRYFNEIDKIIKDEDLSQQKAMEAIKKVSKNINALSTAYPNIDETYLSSGLSIGNIVGSIFEPKNILADPSKIIKELISLPIRKLYSRFSLRNSYILFSLINKHNNLKSMARLIEEFIGRKLHSEVIIDIEQYILYSKSIS